MNALLFSFLFALNVSLWHCFVWKLPAILIEALFCLLTFKSQASKQSALSTGIGTAVFLSSVVSISRLVCPTLCHICYDHLFFLTGCTDSFLSISVVHFVTLGLQASAHSALSALFDSAVVLLSVILSSVF